MIVRLVRRRYVVTWHWRDDSPRTLKSDEMTATTAEAACKQLRRSLAEEYSFSKSELVIVEAKLNE